MAAFREPVQAAAATEAKLALFESTKRLDVDRRALLLSLEESDCALAQKERGERLQQRRRRVEAAAEGARPLGVDVGDAGDGRSLEGAEGNGGGGGVGTGVGVGGSVGVGGGVGVGGRVGVGGGVGGRGDGALGDERAASDVCGPRGQSDGEGDVDAVGAALREAARLEVASVRAEASGLRETICGLEMRIST
eukprot:3418742-Pleurochrysis_carterae.AAC.1